MGHPRKRHQHAEMEDVKSPSLPQSTTTRTSTLTLKLTLTELGQRGSRACGSLGRTVVTRTSSSLHRAQFKIDIKNIKKRLRTELLTKDRQGIQQERLPENRRHCDANWSTYPLEILSHSIANIPIEKHVGIHEVHHCWLLSFGHRLQHQRWVHISIVIRCTFCKCTRKHSHNCCVNIHNEFRWSKCNYICPNKVASVICHLGVSKSKSQVCRSLQWVKCFIYLFVYTYCFFVANFTVLLRCL